MTKDAVTEDKQLLTRTQVAKRLGISTSSVRRLEWDRLQPEVDDRGVHRFDPAEVDALATPRAREPARPRSVNPEARERSRRGKLAADIFRMFARQTTLAEIVHYTKQPPEVIRDLYREWSTSLEDGEWARRDAVERS